MRIFKYLAACVGMAVLFFVAAKPAQAQEPHYLKTLSELRTARDYIQFDHWPDLQGQLGGAVAEINKALQEIKRAAWDDGMATGFTPPPGMVDPWFALHQASTALEAANRHAKEGVDIPQNTGLRERAIGHIEQAETMVNNILRYERH